VPRKTKTTEKDPTVSKGVAKGRFWLPNDARWGGFINIRLSEEQTGEFHGWYAVNQQHVAGYLDDHLADGVKFGAAYDAENECVIVTYTGALVSKSNERYCVTSRAGTLSAAVALAVWKHEVLAQGDYGAYNVRTGEFRSEV